MPLRVYPLGQQVRQRVHGPGISRTTRAPKPPQLGDEESGHAYDDGAVPNDNSALT